VKEDDTTEAGRDRRKSVGGRI